MAISGSLPSVDLMASHPEGTPGNEPIPRLDHRLAARIVGMDVADVREAIKNDQLRSDLTRDVETALTDPRAVGDPQALEVFHATYPTFQPDQLAEMLDAEAEHLAKLEQVLSQKKTFLDRMKGLGTRVLRSPVDAVNWWREHPIKNTVKIAIGGVILTLGGAIAAGLGMSWLERFYRQIGLGKLVDGTKAILPLGSIAAGTNPSIYTPGGPTTVPRVGGPGTFTTT